MSTLLVDILITLFKCHVNITVSILDVMETDIIDVDTHVYHNE